MQSFFDHLLRISEPVFSKEHWPIRVDELPIEEQLQLQNAANALYQNLIALQFQLSYHAHISIGDLDNMSRNEYTLFFEELKRQKEEEKRSIEEAKVSKS